MDKEKLKKIKILYYPYKAAKETYQNTKGFFTDIKARRFLEKNKNRSTCNEKIHVGFIVQMVNIWDKIVDIYEHMDNDDRFEVYMFVVPPYDYTNGVLKDYSNNYFLNEYPKSIKIVKENGDVNKLTKYNLDYVFLQRPYDVYLPEGLKSKDLCKYTKVCYVPYGFDMAKEYISMGTDKHFFRNVYFAFMCNSDTKEILMNKFSYNTKHGLQKFYCIGYPEFDRYYLLGKTHNENITLLWTPRWNYDPVIGGSHFFEYKDNIIELSKEYPDLHIIVRPHPLMFENFIKKGLMSEQQVRQFKNDLYQNGIELSECRTGYDDLIRTDILLSDFSSIIAPFFMTGKPVIFCESLKVSTYSESKLIFDTIYKANDWSSIKILISKLYNGLDERKNDRIESIKKLSNGKVAKEIVEIIASDFKESNIS